MTGAPQNAQVDVVIVSYNTRELLLGCIASVIESGGDIAVELAVVDNNSTDGSLEAVHTQFQHVTVISNHSNVGFGAACNQAIRTTSAPLILLLNSDATLTPEGLRALRDRMTATEVCGAAGCRLVDAEGVETVNTRNFLTAFNQAFELAGLTNRINARWLCRTHRPRFEGEPFDCSVDWIDGACLMLRRAALDEIGLFDERFFMYSEDEDLCYRLRQRGWSICFSAAGQVVHHGGASAEQNRPEMLRQFYASQQLFLLKHRGGGSVFFYRISMKTVLTLKALLARLFGNDARCSELAERLHALRRAISSMTNARPGTSTRESTKR